MNYYKARQRVSDEKWDFTCHNDNMGKTWRVGICAHGKCSHDTPEEAQECYKQYLLGKVKLEAGEFKPWHVCDVEGCDADTNVSTKAGQYHRWALCEKHRTREVVEELLNPVNFFGSY